MSTRASYNANQAVQAVSLCGTPLAPSRGSSSSGYQTRLVALASGSHVEVLKLDAPRISQQCILHANRTSRYTVTDVSFCPLDAVLIAASATNGTVAVFDLQAGRSKWDSDSGENARSVSRVSWSPSDRHVLASANMDGTVRLFDLRKLEGCEVLKLRTDAIRDVQFSPFDAHCLAAVCDSGFLSLWDRRFPQAPVSKFSAHTMCGLCLAWHGSRRGVIATGSRDKMVKIWDVSDGAGTGIGAGTGTSSTESTSTAGGEGADRQPPRPIHVLHTPSAVGRVAWRVQSEQQARTGWAARPGVRGEMEQQLATTSSSEGGEISVWHLGAPGQPACVLSGHQETCTDFQWLDTPGKPGEDSSAAVLAAAGLASSGGSGDDHLSLDLDGRTDVRDCSLGVMQHLLSVGKDGRLLVQDVRCGYFFAQHTARCTTAISSQGHVAFSRGFVPREDTLALAVTPETAAAPGFFADAPELFGYPPSVPAPEPDPTPPAPSPQAASALAEKATAGGKGSSGKANRRKAKGKDARAGDAPPQETAPVSPALTPSASANATGISSTLPAASSEASCFETGVVFCGLADISDLQNARSVRALRGAEGGVFDPAVISLLARSYVLGKGRSRVDARQACEFNLKVAADAGLASRAGLWAATLVLLQVDPAPAGSAPTPASAPAALPPALSPTPGFSASSSLPTGAPLRAPALSPSLLASPTTAPSLRDRLPEEVPFGLGLLGALLLELLEGGDTQHFVCLCEVLRRADLVEPACAEARIGDMRRREAYLAYFDLLSRLQLFCAANAIIKVRLCSTSPVSLHL